MSDRERRQLIKLLNKWLDCPNDGWVNPLRKEQPMFAKLMEQVIYWIKQEITE